MTAYIVTVIITAVCSLSAAGLLAYHTARLISRQIKLYHSINLVELKTPKLIYWIFAGIIGALIVFTVIAMSGFGDIIGAFADSYGVSRAHAVTAFVFPFVALVAAEAFVVVLGVSKNAVVDKGVYTDFSMLDWHHVHDYVIDEDKCILILSSDKNTFATLKNLTPPFRVAKADIQKLKFILNKNKNKFSGFTGDGGLA